MEVKKIRKIANRKEYKRGKLIIIYFRVEIGRNMYEHCLGCKSKKAKDVYIIHGESGESISDKILEDAINQFVAKMHSKRKSNFWQVAKYSFKIVSFILRIRKGRG